MSERDHDQRRHLGQQQENVKVQHCDQDDMHAMVESNECMGRQWGVFHADQE